MPQEIETARPEGQAECEEPKPCEADITGRARQDSDPAPVDLGHLAEGCAELRRRAIRRMAGAS